MLLNNEGYRKQNITFWDGGRRGRVQGVTYEIFWEFVPKTLNEWGIWKVVGIFTKKIYSLITKGFLNGRQNT